MRTVHEVRILAVTSLLTISNENAVQGDRQRVTDRPIVFAAPTSVTRYEHLVDLVQYPNSPSWMRRSFMVHARDICQVMHNLLGNAEFDGKFDYVAYEEFVNGKRRYSNFMSGQWATKESVFGSSILL